MVSQHRKPEVKRRTLSAQDVPEELWDMAHAFIEAYPRMKGRGDLVRAAVESYIALATEYGLDGNWRPQVPGVQTDIYKNAHDKLLGNAA